MLDHAPGSWTVTLAQKIMLNDKMLIMGVSKSKLQKAQGITGTCVYVIDVNCNSAQTSLQHDAERECTAKSSANACPIRQGSNVGRH